AGRHHDPVKGHEQRWLGAHIGAEFELHAVAQAGADESLDVTLEAWFVCGDFLEPRRLAGEPERAAGNALLFEHHHLIAPGHERRIGEASGTGTDNRDALAARRRAVRKQALASHRTIHHATDAGAAAHLVHAGIAGKAAADRLTAAKFFDPLWICDQAA